MAVFNIPISWQAVAGDIGDVGHQATVALDDVDQVAAHFCAWDRFAVKLEARVLERDDANQCRLNAVGQRKLGLHEHAAPALRASEEQQQSNPETVTNQDPDPLE